MNVLKYFIVFILQVLSVPMFSQEQSASFRNLRYDILFNEVSPDGRYLSFRKVYQNSRDSMVVMQTAQPEVVFYQTAGVTKSFFSRTNTLFILKRSTLEILNFKSGRPQQHDHVTKVEYLPKQKIIVATAKDEEHEKILIFSEEGKMVRSIPNISRLMTLPNGDALITVKKNGSSFLFELVRGEAVLLYTTGGEITAVTASDAEQLVLQEKHPGSAMSEMVYVDKQSLEVYPLKNIVSLPFVASSTTFTESKGEVYVQAYLKDGAVPDKNPDIWYGNDPAISKKFYPPGERLSYFLWDVRGHKIKVLDSKKFPEIAYVGNLRYYVATDPFEFQDYTARDAPLLLRRYDVQTDAYAELGMMGPHVIFDRTGAYMVSKLGKEWKLINLLDLSKRSIPLPEAETAVFSEDGRSIYFEQQGTVVRYETHSGRMKFFKTAPGFSARIKGVEEEKLLWQFGLYRSTVRDHLPLLVELQNKKTGSSGLMLIKGEKTEFPAPPNPDRISSVRFDPQTGTVSYVTENLTVPPKVWMKIRGAHSQLVYNSNKTDSDVSKIRKEIYNYHNSENKPLSGVLIYPSNFDPEKKYPMIVQIYEMESKFRNSYLRDGYYTLHEGFNIRHFLENGYFVLMPDIVFGAKGTGYSALDCVEKALAAISGHANIDFKRVGLIGHSHGAYETNFIATQSKSFATYVSGAGNADLVRSYFSYNYNFNGPFYWQFEERQYRMFKPFAEDKNLYINNSPVYYAEKVSKPILLWTGKQDQNINWEQTMEFYLALRRAKRTVTALFYDGEGHTIADPVRKKDLFTRISDWFGYYLKDEPSDWINPGEK